MSKTDRSLQKKRLLIDKVDAELVRLLKKRFSYVRDIGKIKAKNNVSVYNKKREAEIIKRTKNNLVEHKNKKQILRIYISILVESLKFLRQNKK